MLLRDSPAVPKHVKLYGFFYEMNSGELIEVDARPSDAIALAVTASVPIYVAEEVLEEVCGE